MSVVNLTVRTIQQAKPKATEYFFNDGDGLFLRVLPSGVKTWQLRLSRNKRDIKKSLGRFPEVSLSQARELATALRATLAAGEDPNNDDSTDPKFLNALFEKWFADYIQVNRTSEENNDALKARYDNYVRPKLGLAELHTLRRGAILRLLDSVVKKGKLRQANLVLSELRQMFTYAAVREWILGDPTAGIAKKDAGGAEEPGERTLSEVELQHLKVILCAPRASSKSVFSRTLPIRTELAVWLALSTLARSVEIATVKAADVDLEKGVWNIPADIAKNATPHVVHLSELSTKVFEILLSMQPKGYLFPGRGKRQYIQEKAFTRELTDRQGREKPLKGRRNSVELLLQGGKWTMHDLRRTGATMLGEMDFDEKLIDLCLNHKEVNKLKKTYQKQKRLPARKEAFDALGTKLSAILDGFDWLPTPSLRQMASQRSEAPAR